MFQCIAPFISYYECSQPLLATSASGVFGPMVRATFSPGCLPDLLCSSYYQARKKCFHLCHVDRVVSIASTPFGRLEDRVAIAVSNDSISLDALTTLEMASISV
jgi:hypothetical protein